MKTISDVIHSRWHDLSERAQHHILATRPHVVERGVLRRGAGTSHAEARDMYDDYGWLRDTEAYGQVALQIVEYGWLDAATADVVERLRSEYPDLSLDEAYDIVEKARVVRDDMEAVEAALERAVDAYIDDDFAAVVEALDEASRIERDHGDDPSTRALRRRLVEAVGR